MFVCSTGVTARPGPEGCSGRDTDCANGLGRATAFLDGKDGVATELYLRACAAASVVISAVKAG